MEVTKLQEAANINEEKNRKLFRRYFLFFVIIFLVVGSFFLGVEKGKNTKEERNVEEFLPISGTQVENKLSAKNNVDFALFWKVWDMLEEKHIDKEKLDAQKLVYGAIDGMLKATGDPYTSFFDPEESRSFSEEIEGSFEGIGAELGIKENILTVIAPLEDSPAQKAGLRAGDKILKIGEEIVADVTIDDAVKKIRGEKGSEVKLTILHSGEEETKEITIIRDTIEVKTVKIEFKENDIAHVKITRFGENTNKEFNEAVNQIIARKSKGIVLDLRNNPGGLLEKAVDVASKMIPKGKVVVTEEDYQGKKVNLETKGGDKLSAIPMVVLINEGSASASEILAGALKDNQGTVMIGKKSFGKGTVQELIRLPKDSSVKITVAKWLTPNGEYIMEKGIMPEVEVDLTLEDFQNERDPQLDRALEIIKEKMTVSN